MKTDQLPEELLELIQKEVPYTDYKDAVRSFFEDNLEAIKAILNPEKEEKKEEGGMGVAMTYGEIFKRARRREFSVASIGIDSFYLINGGDPSRIFFMGAKSAEKLGMSREEIEGRGNWFPFLDAP